DAGRGAAVQRATHRADRAGERGGDVGAGGGDHASGEGRGVHAVLGRGRPVRVDRLDVLRVGLTPPADQELLREGVALVDLTLRDDRLVDVARGLAGVREHHDGSAGEVLADLLRRAVVGLLEAEGRGQHRDRGLQVDAYVAGVHRQAVRLGRRQAGGVRPVDEQAPDVLERNPSGQLLDVHTAVAERRAFLVGLSDRRLESNDSFEAVMNLHHDAPPWVCKSRRVDSALLVGSRLTLANMSITEAIAAARRDYTQAGLSEEDLTASPFELFQRWYDEAATLIEPNAMVLATTSADGQPSARMVLLKGLSADGFVFFTNQGSRKGQDLATNPRAALLFPWHPLERQVRIEGPVEALSETEVAAYFATRPRGAQLGAWASHQSRPVSGRAELETAFTEAEDMFLDAEVTVPPEWGGYRVRPEMVEFWQGRTSRMHDRLVYERDGDAWRTQRLAP